MYVVQCTLILLVCALHTQCARILGVFNTPSISHQVVFQPIWRELSLRGHEVVVMTTDPLKDRSLVNLTEVDIGFLYGVVQQVVQVMSKGVGHWEMVDQMVTMGTLMTEDFLSHSEVLKIINDNETKYDVVLAEAIFPTTFAFAAKLKCPLVGVPSLNVLEHLHNSLGTPGHPILYPDLSTDYGANMSFWRKVDAVLYDMYSKYVYVYKFIPAMDKIVRKYFGNDTPSLLELQKNLSIVLLNSNPILHKPRPYGPNVIELGGRLHLQPKKPLPAVSSLR